MLKYLTMSNLTTKVVDVVGTSRWQEAKVEERKTNQKNKEFSKEF